MLNVITVLKSFKHLDDKKALEYLKELYGVECNFHPIKPLVILNYSQINSPRFNPVADECRGLVLEVGTWKVVAAPFKRFYNLHEYPKADIEEFFKCKFHCGTKEDGSLIIVYNYDGEWMVNTRKTFGDCIIEGTNFTWRDLFLSAVGGIEKLKDNFNPKRTYVFELTTPYNKVVRIYPEVSTKLLAIFGILNGGYGVFETLQEFVKSFAERNNIKTPKYFNFANIQEIEEYIKTLEENDPTNEGVVLYSSSLNMRVKIKNKMYLTLHHMCDNGNLFATKRLLPWVLKGEVSELIAYFPEASDKVSKMLNKFYSAVSDANALWLKHHKIESQKEFAQSVSSNPLSSFLFKNRASKGNAETLVDMIFKSEHSERIIFKQIFGEGDNWYAEQPI